MAAKTCKVSREWLKLFDENNIKFESFLKIVNDHEINCLVCVSSIDVKSKGLAAVTQHLQKKKHKDNIKPKFDDNQLLIQPSTSNSAKNQPFRLYTSKDATTRAEVLFILDGLAKNASFRSFDNLANVLRKAITDSEMVKRITLERTKVYYIVTFALGPHFYEEMINDIDKSLYFTLSFDETVNNANQKELQIRIRYFSKHFQCALSRHLQTFFLGSATADIVIEKIFEAVHNANLSVNKLFMLGMDGPVVNESIFKKINSKLNTSRGFPLIDVGSCNLHVVHNSFRKGLKVLGDDTADLITQSYNWFHNFPARREKFNNVCKRKEVEAKCIIKHVESRWLTLLEAAERYLYLLPSITTYFSEIPKKEKSKHYQNIYRYLKATKVDDVELNLFVVIESAELFNHFLKKFQKHKTLIHVLHDHLKNLLLLIASKICKKVEKEADIDAIFETENLIEVKDIKFSEKIKQRLEKLEKVNKTPFKEEFGQKYINHYLEAAKYLIGKVEWKKLKLFKVLSPAHLFRESIEDTEYLDGVLKFISSDEIDHCMLKNEYKLFKIELKSRKEEDVVLNEKNVDEYWKEFIKTNGHEYPNFTKFVKSVLSSSHGQSDVERGFSASSMVLTEDRTKISEATLNARMNSKDTLKLFDNVPTRVPINDQLIGMVQSARKQYELHLEAEKEKRLQEKKEQEAKAKERTLLSEQGKRRLEVDAADRKIEEVKRQMIDKKSAVAAVTKSAEEMLQKGIDSNNIQMIKVANSMFTKAKEQRTDLEIDENTLNVLAKDKKKSLGKITSFFGTK